MWQLEEGETQRPAPPSESASWGLLQHSRKPAVGRGQSPERQAQTPFQHRDSSGHPQPPQLLP